jgi:dATP pyrophosphohydrolase
MRAPTSDHVEVYVFRRRGRRVEFLALRRAEGRRLLPGIWQPVTGQRRRGERALHTAAREVLEETGLRPSRWWALETVTLYLDASTDRLAVLPLFAAEVGPDDLVVPSKEHDAHAWLGARAAGERYLWESQRRGLDSVRRGVLRGGRLALALEVTNWLKRTGARRPRRPAPRGRST